MAGRFEPTKNTVAIFRQTLAKWLDQDPILAAYEIAYQTDTNKIRIGDGSSLFSVLSDIGGGAEIGSPVTGGTAGSVLFLGAGGVLEQDNARFFWDNTAKQLQLNSGAIGEVPLKIKGITGQTANLLQIQDSAGLNRISANITGNDSFIDLAPVPILGNVGLKVEGNWLLQRTSGNGLVFGGASVFTFGTSTSILDWLGGVIQFQSTITAAGTTGAQTINKVSGSVNFAASASSLVVTNSIVSANSIVIAIVMTNDATLKSVQAVPAAGSFTLFGNAAATAETKVGFIVFNA